MWSLEGPFGGSPSGSGGKVLWVSRLRMVEIVMLEGYARGSEPRRDIEKLDVDGYWGRKLVEWVGWEVGGEHGSGPL
jgi:hypothetical protein